MSVDLDWDMNPRPPFAERPTCDEELDVDIMTYREKEEICGGRNDNVKSMGGAELSH
jgi:hypothetical protein